MCVPLSPFLCRSPFLAPEAWKRKESGFVPLSSAMCSFISNPLLFLFLSHPKFRKERSQGLFLYPSLSVPLFPLLLLISFSYTGCLEKRSQALFLYPVLRVPLFPLLCVLIFSLKLGRERNQALFLYAILRVPLSPLLCCSHLCFVTPEVQTGVRAYLETATGDA